MFAKSKSSFGIVKYENCTAAFLPYLNVSFLTLDCNKMGNAPSFSLTVQFLLFLLLIYVFKHSQIFTNLGRVEWWFAEHDRRMSFAAGLCSPVGGNHDHRWESHRAEPTRDESLVSWEQSDFMDFLTDCTRQTAFESSPKCLAELQCLLQQQPPSFDFKTSWNGESAVFLAWLA